MSKIKDISVKFKFSKNVKRCGLLISYDEKKHPVIYVGNENKNVYLKKFCGRFDLDKFLAEAVILRMCANKATTMNTVRSIYNNIVAFVQDEESEKHEIM